MGNLKLSITHYKVLHTIKSLNELNMYPLQEGVAKILNGVVDEETLKIKDIPTFGTLISYSSKKICHYVLALKRYGYITYILNRIDNQLYLTTTEKGNIELFEFLQKRKNPYKKVEKKFKKTIAEIY